MITEKEIRTFLRLQHKKLLTESESKQLERLIPLWNQYMDASLNKFNTIANTKDSKPAH